MVDWFTGDWSLNQKNIITYYHRPFETTDEMNEAIIENTNNCVRDNDRLYIAGNFMFGPLEEDKFVRTARYFRRQLRCRNIYLVYGNHDRRAKKIEDFFGLFSKCADYMELKSHGDQSIILFHYPLLAWNRQHHGAWQLHSHVHGTLPDNPNILAMDIGIDATAMLLRKKATEKGETTAKPSFLYRPLEFDEIAEFLKAKPGFSKLPAVGQFGFD